MGSLSSPKIPCSGNSLHINVLKWSSMKKSDVETSVPSSLNKNSAGSIAFCNLPAMNSVASTQKLEKSSNEIISAY